MTIGRAAVIGLVLVALAACGDDDGESAGETVATAASSTTTTTSTTTTSTTVATATSEATTTTAAPSANSSSTAPTTTVPAAPDLIAIWPAPTVIFDEPQDAAADFVEHVLDVPASLGEFREGDANSGEIDVFSPGEGASPTPTLRGTLILQRTGADDGWFVIAGFGENATIVEPAARAQVPAGPLTVSGEALGFEANVVVFAFPQGDADAELDRVVTLAGAMFEPEPYSVELDLSGAAAGDVVGIVVRGGAGLETDPGDFAAIPVVIGE